MLINIQHLTQPVWHTASSFDAMLSRVGTICVDGLPGYAAVAPIPSLFIDRGGSTFDRNVTPMLSENGYGIGRKDLPMFVSTKNWHENDERSGSLTNEIDQHDLLRLTKLYRQRWKPDGTRGKPKTPH